MSTVPNMPGEPLFVFCADLHLEDGAWSTRPGIFGDSYFSLKQIVSYCIAHRLPMIMGGDVLEKKSNSARPIARLCYELTRMQDAQLAVYYIQGNHEFDRNAPWLSVHPWPKHMHLNGLFDINGVAVTGLDWLPRGDIQREFEKVHPETEILVTHQVWKDFMGNIGRTDCELTDVHNVTLVLAGDFHVTKTVQSINAQGQPITMLSPGSTCMQDMGESCDKYFLVAHKDSAGSFQFSQQKLLTRRFANYVVKEQAELDELCSGKLRADIAAMLAPDILPPEINKPLVRIKFDKQLPDAYLRLMTAVGDFAHIACEAISEKRHTDESLGARANSKNDLLAAMATLLGESTDAYKLGVALLTAEDAAKELNSQFAQYLLAATTPDDDN